MRQKLIRKKRNIVTKLLITLFLLVVLSLGFIFVYFDLLTVKSIDVSLDRLECASEQQIKGVVNILGQNFLMIDEKITAKKLQEKFFCVREVNFSKQLPNKIIMKVSGRKGAVVLSSFQQVEATGSAQVIATSSAIPSKQFLVDEEGVIFSDKIQSNLPILYIGTDGLTLGKKLPSGLVKNSLDILNKLKTFGLEVKEAKIDQQRYLLINTNMGIAIIFEANEKLDYQLAALQLIVTQAKINDEKMEFIDLRFDKPVVKYAPKKK